jgi:hypothetical protein
MARIIPLKIVRHRILSYAFVALVLERGSFDMTNVLRKWFPR